MTGIIPTYTTDSPTAVTYANASLQQRNGVWLFSRSSLYDQGAGLTAVDGVYHVDTGTLPRGISMRISGNSVVLET